MELSDLVRFAERLGKNESFLIWMELRVHCSSLSIQHTVYLKDTPTLLIIDLLFSQGIINRFLLMRGPSDNYNLWLGYLLMKVTLDLGKHLISIIQIKMISDQDNFWRKNYLNPEFLVSAHASDV